MLISRQEQARHIHLVPGQAHVDALIAEQFRGTAQAGPIQAPPVFTLSQWVSEHARNTDLLQGRATAISPEALDIKCLWESIIVDQTPGISAEEGFALAAQAAQTDRLLEQWVCSSGRPGNRSTNGQFQGWRQQFAVELKHRNWFRSSDWMRHFGEQISNRTFPSNQLPESITLAGFVELTPLEASILEALKARGVTVNTPETPACKTETCMKTGYPDIDQELAAAAQWASQKVALGCHNIAVIINGLESLSGTVRTIMENTFDPQGTLAYRAGEHGIFSLPSGAKLATHPLASNALLLLKLALGGRHQAQDFSDISRLLLSGSLHGGQKERFARARLEVKVRDLGYARCSLSMLGELANRVPDPDSLQHLRACLNAILESPKTANPVAQLLEWLRSWGWPGTQTPTPASLAAYNGFLQMLERLSRSGAGSARLACRQLRRLCAEATLPGSGGALSPVQVLSPEQAYGRQFEAVWVANLTLENWPPRPVTSAFLTPQDVRRIPRATEQGMLAYTRRLTRWLVGCAPEVRLSWCDRMNDLPMSPSPLIADYPPGEKAVTGVPELWAGICPSAAGIESFSGHEWLHEDKQAQGQIVSVTETPYLQSAVSMLNFQSACPLAAYLAFRLDARMPSVPNPFADASYRGKLVHAALLRLYQAHRGRRSLPGFSEIEAAVEYALEAERADRHLLPALYAAEKQLMGGMLQDWLAWEQNLQPFEIAELEWRTELPLAGFDVRVQVDRIDRLADGRTVLLDYKTGTGSSSSGWADDRLQDIQLPLYAVLLSQANELAPAAVVFANVGLYEAGTEGIGDDPAAANYGIAGYTTKPRALAQQLGSWSQTLLAWERKIDTLVQEFVAGDARHQVFHEGGLSYAGLDGLMRTGEAKRWLEERSPDGCN